MIDKQSLSLDFLPPIKTFVLLLTIAAGFFLLNKTPLRDLLYNSEWVQGQFLASKNVKSILLFIAGGGILTVFGFPRLVLSAIGGFVYGTMSGTLYALAGTLWGCFLSFFYSRFLAQEFVRSHIPEKAMKVETLLLSQPFLVSIMIRNLPVGNNTITNLMAGVSRIKTVPYFSGSLIGFIPQTLVFSLLGSGISRDGTIQVVISLILFAATIGFMWYLIQIIRTNMNE